MSLNPIGLATPVFFVLIGIEFWVARSRRQRVNRLNDSIADMTCGMGDQVIGLFFKGLSLAIYAAIYRLTGFLELPADHAWTWVVGMVGVDLLYYFYHRFSHRVNWAWATHAVHHQSEEYNLAVALRQPWFAQFYGWIFYVPLAVLGLPPVVWVTCYAFNLLYQFWIHTQMIGRLGPLEWVFNTPSHHRVHHGTNPHYIDTNYAGILIIWDRMFGTFTPEKEESLYGTLKPLRSWNPLWANVQPFLQIAKDAQAQPRLMDKWKVWWMPPGWTPEGVQPPAFPAPDRGYDRSSIRELPAYVLAHFIPVSAVMGWALTFEQTAAPVYLGAAALFVVWTGMGWAGLFERRRWAVPFELARLAAVGAGGMVWAAPQTTVVFLFAAAVATACVGSAYWVWARRTALAAA